MSVEICPKCGTENITKAAWCEKCLHMFHEYGEKKTIFCPECKHENAYKDSYCEACHEPLKPGQWE
jgi:predicted Zn-ribbon and HTH transcriptional regulator